MHWPALPWKAEAWVTCYVYIPGQEGILLTTIDLHNRRILDASLALQPLPLRRSGIGAGVTPREIASRLVYATQEPVRLILFILAGFVACSDFDVSANLVRAARVLLDTHLWILNT